MKRPAFFRYALSRMLFLFLGAAALALAPQLTFAQHGGGHAGGGGHFGGGMGGGGGSPHFSSPPAQHYSPPPAPHVQPATHFARPAAAYVPPRVPPPVNSVVNNRIVHPEPAPGNVPRTGAGFAAVQPGRAPLTIGFPSTEASPSVEQNSATLGAAIARPGAPLRFFGEGHQIYSEPADGAAVASSRTGSSALTENAFRGPAAGISSASTLPVGRPHIFPPHVRVPPIWIGPGFGYGGLGYGLGYGYGFGSPFYFGDPFFFGDPFLGFQYGSVWVPCNGYGPGLQCMPYNSDYGDEQPYTSTMIGGTETETQSQQIFSPYSPGYPPPEENTAAENNNAPSANEFVLYLKDGSVYVVNDYWYADGKLVYSTSTGQDSVDLDRIDMQKTLDVNARRGLVFTLRPAPPDAASPSPDAPARPNSAQPDQQPQPNQNAPAPVPQP